MYSTKAVLLYSNNDRPSSLNIRSRTFQVRLWGNKRTICLTVIKTTKRLNNHISKTDHETRFVTMMVHIECTILPSSQLQTKASIP